MLRSQHFLTKIEHLSKKENYYRQFTSNTITNYVGLAINTTQVDLESIQNYIDK